jgi:ketosteroid isomerase-like protein
VTLPVSPLTRFYDVLDGAADGAAIDHLADDFQFEVMRPGSPPTRLRGGKHDFESVAQDLPRAWPEHRAAQRLHQIDTVASVAGIELAVGRRAGTLLAAAQAGPDGRLARYAEVVSSEVTFSDAGDRMPPSPGLLQAYFDRVDCITLDEAIDLVAEDYQFEMVFPGLAGSPDERNSRSKADFRAFQARIRSRNPRPTSPVAAKMRRHHTRVAAVANNVVLVVAETINGRRNGTIIAAAEADADGRMKRYLIGMTPSVRFRFRDG